MSTVITALLVGLVGIIGLIWLTYNRLITLRMRVKEAFADIDVQLKKRYDLLPDLVETVRKATAVDEDILTKVTKLRSMAMEESTKGKSIAERSKIENEISSMMKGIRIQVEAYPDIKSHGELNNLMNKVTEIEEKIAYARRFYNGNVMSYNTQIKLFPAVVIAGMLSFSSEPFFEALDDEKKDIKVKL